MNELTKEQKGLIKIGEAVIDLCAAWDSGSPQMPVVTLNRHGDIMKAAREVIALRKAAAPAPVAAPEPAAVVNADRRQEFLRWLEWYNCGEASVALSAKSGYLTFGEEVSGITSEFHLSCIEDLIRNAPAPDPKQAEIDATLRKIGEIVSDEMDENGFLKSPNSLTWYAAPSVLQEAVAKLRALMKPPAPTPAERAGQILDVMEHDSYDMLGKSEQEQVIDILRQTRDGRLVPAEVQR